MTESLNHYDLKNMTACIEGKVPVVKDVAEAVLRRLPIKVLYPDNSVQYGYIDSYSPRANTFNLKVPGETSCIIHGLNFDTHRIFHATGLHQSIPRHIADIIVINGELFTVVVNHEICPIWIGNENLVYYAEDIQSLIELYGCIIIGQPY